MTRYRQGDIILVPFPFTDFSTFKQRPALVISSSRFNRSQNDLLIAAISSHVAQRKTPYEYRLTAVE
jgi:mRNA interferase MazF